VNRVFVAAYPASMSRNDTSLSVCLSDCRTHNVSISATNSAWPAVSYTTLSRWQKTRACNGRNETVHWTTVFGPYVCRGRRFALLRVFYSTM